MIRKLSSRKFDSQNDLCNQYQSKRAVIFVETNFIDYKCVQRFMDKVTDCGCEQKARMELLPALVGEDLNSTFCHLGTQTLRYSLP